MPRITLCTQEPSSLPTKSSDIAHLTQTCNAISLTNRLDASNIEVKFGVHGIDHLQANRRVKVWETSKGLRVAHTKIIVL
jgi:hypothetical protein